MLNISKQIYAGWDTNSTKYDLPEAEIVPVGDTSNEQRKADRIAKKFSAIYEHENYPLPGFTLYKTDRKNWGSLDQTWLVIDPRGFLVRISSRNLENILHVTGITEGLIQEKCVWAREDSQTKMTLVPVSSPIFVDATKNTELLEQRVDIKNVNIGDIVLMQNKLQGRYMGTLSLYAPLENNGKKEFVHQSYLRRQIVEVEPGKFFYQTDTKILKVLRPAPEVMTKEQSVEYLNQQIAAGAYFTSAPWFPGSCMYYSTRGMIRHASTFAVPKPVITLQEIDLAEACALAQKGLDLKDSSMVLLENAHGVRYLLDFPYTFSNTPNPTLQSFSITKAIFQEGVYSSIQVPDQKHTFAAQAIAGSHSINQFTRFYRILKHVKTETYI